MVQEYNSTLATGGDSLTEDLNVYYEVCPALPTYLLQADSILEMYTNTKSIQSGDIAWMITATALVLLMIPGVG